MTGGVITENISAMNGAGVRVDSGTFNMSGGVINNISGSGAIGVQTPGTVNISGTALIADNNTNGILIWNGGRVTMSGGTIARNHGVDYGGIRQGGGGVFNMSGGIIYGTCDPTNANTASNGYDTLVGYLNFGTFATPADPASAFTPSGTISNENRTIEVRDGELLRPIAATVSLNGGAAEDFTSLQAAINAANVAGEHIVTILANQSLTPVTFVNGANIRLTAANPVTVTLSANGSMFTVETGGTLTL
jgi:hypothetical protein